MCRSVSTRLPESQRQSSSVESVKRVAAAPAADEVEERVDVPVVRHDLAGEGLDGVAVEQVADPRVETSGRRRRAP